MVVVNFFRFYGIRFDSALVWRRFEANILRFARRETNNGGVLGERKL